MPKFLNEYIICPEITFVCRSHLMENQDKVLTHIGINSRISNIQYPISNIQ
ncbi:hypothetical protein P0082_06995 [Candidatus Haliotispira prima]|uniref:Uncharacterized protein n=1 Tax=Candidatus Haliotispira prima TaxID=3034016 RepID=A0ABY8MGB7_9SPIO|nr:hypothetical protein P0082_06995 [Candidatus Haliotispira prima]